MPDAPSVGEEIAGLISGLIADQVRNLTPNQVAILTVDQIIAMLLEGGHELEFALGYRRITGSFLRDPTLGMTDGEIAELRHNLVRERLSAHPDEMPTMRQLNERISRMVQDEGEWAGAPALIDHYPLVLEPRYPHQRLNGQSWQSLVGEPEGSPLSSLYRVWASHPKCQDDHLIVNHWYNHRWNADVYVCGELWPGPVGCGWPAWMPVVRYPVVVSAALGKDRLDLLLGTMMASKAWTVEAEFQALEKLRGLIPEHKFCSYLTTGCFLETSPRSKVKYLFRRGKPTLACSVRDDQLEFLTALCAHPIGYYQDTYAGAMVPTDDVIAHLVLMRGDERKFWGKCQHHVAYDVRAGI